MATYGKRRHIIPVLSAPRGSTACWRSKRPRHRIQGSLEDTAPTIYGSEMSGSASICRRDSIDEMADILLDDTATKECRVDHTMEMHSPDNYTPKKPSSHLKDDCNSMVPHGSSQRNLIAINSVEETNLNDGRLEEILPMRATNAGESPPARHDISQIKPLTRNIGNTNGSLEVMVRTAKSLSPDGTDSLSLEPYQLHDDRRFTTNKNPYEEATLGNRNVYRPQSTNYTESGGPSTVSNGVPPAKPSAFNAVDVNNKIQAMLAATRALKPDASNSLRPGPYTPVKTSRLKDGNVLTKMKTAMNHIPGRANKKSPELAEMADEGEVMAQPSVPNMELRMNEGDNLSNPKIISLTGHGKIRRKPLPDDGKLLRNQNSSSFKLVQSKSEPVLHLSSDMPSNSVELSEVDNTTEPFPSYDTSFDIPFSSSPFAQSTPRLCMQPTFEDVNEDYSDMDLDINAGEMIPVVRRDVSQLKSFRPPTRPGHGRMKKHPSPSKAELEKWEDIMRHFPGIDNSESRAGGAHDGLVNVYLHPSSVLGYKSTNAKLHELTGNQDKDKGVGMLGFQAPGVAEPSTVMEDAPNRNKGRKSFVSKPRSSKTRSREGTRSGRPQSSVVKNENRMDTDELQWDMTPLLKKAT